MKAKKFYAKTRVKGIKVGMPKVENKKKPTSYKVKFPKSPTGREYIDTEPLNTIDFSEARNG